MKVKILVDETNEFVVIENVFRVMKHATGDTHLFHRNPHYLFASSDSPFRIIPKTQTIAVRDD